MARRSLARNASYLAWLFEVGNDGTRETSMIKPSLFLRMMSTLLPEELEAPSTKIVHMSVVEGWSLFVVISVINSARTCALRDYLLSYWTSNSDNLSDHLSILSSMSGQPRSFLIGWSVLTIMVWDRK